MGKKNEERAESRAMLSTYLNRLALLCFIVSRILALISAFAFDGMLQPHTVWIKSWVSIAQLHNGFQEEMSSLIGVLI